MAETNHIQPQVNRHQKEDTRSCRGMQMSAGYSRCGTEVYRAITRIDDVRVFILCPRFKIVHEMVCSAPGARKEQDTTTRRRNSLRQPVPHAKLRGRAGMVRVDRLTLRNLTIMGSSFKSSLSFAATSMEQTLRTVLTSAVWTDIYSSSKMS